MNGGRRAACLVLCARLLMIGITTGNHLTVARNTINATIGHPLLLPVAITLTHQFSKYTVEWEFENHSILYHTVLNCTLDSRGSPVWILDDHFVVYPTYSGRVEFYKKNSSLLIYKVRENDSGTYKISFYTNHHTASETINVTVLMKQPSDSAAARIWKPWIFVFGKVLCFFPLAALLIIIYVRG